MAMTYQNFASLGVNLNRQKYGPLDISNVFTSEADLKYYLTKGTFTTGVSEYWYKSASEKVVPYPYEGQVLATVIDGVVNVYALSLDAEGNFQTQEIGAKVEVDGKTIKLNADGKLELVGIPADITGKTLVPSLVNGELTWAEPDTSTAEGQAQEIEGLKTRVTALEATVNGTGEGDEHVKGLVEKVADNAQAIADEVNAREAAIGVEANGEAPATGLYKAIADALKAAKDYADENDANTVYDDTVLSGKVNDNASAIAIIQGQIGDTESGLVKDIADNKKAIEDLNTAYAEADADTLEAAQTYTNTAISDLEIDIDREDSVDYIIIKKNGVVIDKVNASLFVQDSFLDDVNYDPETRKITFSWKMGDGSTKSDEIEVADLVDTYTNGTGLKLENNEFSVDTTVIATVESLNAVASVANAAQTAQQVSDAIDAKIENANLGQYAKAADVESTLEGYYTKTDIEGKGYAVATEVASTYATKAELTTHESEIANELLAYAKTADVNAELTKKIETGSIAHSSETVAEGVTVEGTKLNIVVDAYTKQEVRDYVADVIEDMTGGESAADVLLALNNHIATYEEKVGQIDAKDAAQDTAIAKAQADATQGIADAKKVSDDLAALDTRVGNNTNEISVVKGTITTVNETLSGKVTALENKDIELAGLITGLDTAVKGNATTIGEHTADIAALEAKDSEFAGLINTLSNNKADKTTLETLAGNVYTKTEVDNLFKNFDQTAITDAIAANKKAIEDEAARAKVAEEANKALIDTLIGEDANKSVRTIASEEVAKVVDSAPEAFDTLKEIATWIQDDATGAAAMSATIAGHSTILAGFGGEGEPADVKTYVNDQIAAAAYKLPVATLEALGGVKSSEAENGVTVAADGTMSVNSVNVNKLVQTEGEELILNGGKA